MINLIFSNGFFKIETYVFVKQHPARMHISQNTKGAEHMFDFAFPVALTSRNPDIELNFHYQGFEKTILTE